MGAHAGWECGGCPHHLPRRHTLSVYRLSGLGPAAYFAAGEFSNGVWGFYEPTKSMRNFLLTRINIEFGETP